MDYETIFVEKKDQITRITLNRPEALNSFNDQMGEEFYAALKEAEKDKGTRCLIITGPGRALELIMTGRTVGAKEAEKLGLVNQAVPAAELDKVVGDVAEKLANGPTKALGLSKRVVNHVSRLDLQEALEYEAQNQDIAGKTQDHLEAVRAFLEKRQPKFSGT